jgi:hypothetical protein
MYVLERERVLHLGEDEAHDTNGSNQETATKKAKFGNVGRGGASVLRGFRRNRA